MGNIESICLDAFVFISLRQGRLAVNGPQKLSRTTPLARKQRMPEYAVPSSVACVGSIVHRSNSVMIVSYWVKTRFKLFGNP